MAQQINVNIRMDKDIKEQADILFNELGFNLTTAVNAFVRQSIRDRAIPFQIRAKTDEPQQTRAAIIARGKEALREAQMQAILNSTDGLTMDEIDAEIAACRDEKRAAK